MMPQQKTVAVAIHAMSPALGTTQDQRERTTSATEQDSLVTLCKREVVFWCSGHVRST